MAFMTIDEKIKDLESQPEKLRDERDNWLPGWDTAHDAYGPVAVTKGHGSWVQRIECARHDGAPRARRVVILAGGGGGGGGSAVRLRVSLHDLGLFVDRAREFIRKNS